MRKHFRTRDPNDVIITTEEGLLSQRTNWGIFQKSAKTEIQIMLNDCKRYTESKKKMEQDILQ